MRKRLLLDWGRASLWWEPRDLWIGCFWTKEAKVMDTAAGLLRWWQYDVFLCLLPCLPLRFRWTRRVT